MGKAIEQLNNMTVGHVALGSRSGVAGSVKHMVHDADTIVVCAPGNFGVRFLGVDAAEISFQLPGRKTFTSLGQAAWEDFLSDPLAPSWPPFQVPLEPGLVAHLKNHLGPGTATTHYGHATQAEDCLEDLVRADLAALQQTEEQFRFFLVFACEVMDRYGRFLCFANRDQPDPDLPEPRPLSYNERLLQAGVVTPYFIWPNVDPFKKVSLLDAVFKPHAAHQVATGKNKLHDARAWVQAARQKHSGIFDELHPLRLLPFEVRFLARRQPPDRWVIDLGRADDVLLKPQNYYTVTNIEDRLFIPPEYVPLFVERGWRRQP